MNRRTFLKAVFAAAVAPASVVKVLYSPKAGLSDRDIADILTATLNDIKCDPKHLELLEKHRQYMKDYAEAVDKFHAALFQPHKRRS